MWVLDLETDGLLPEVTKIHCASAYNIHTKEWKVFTPYNMVALIPFLKTCQELSCHNGISFDLRVLEKLYYFEYTGKFIDTLLLSRILFPDISPIPKVKGPHSVEAWGVRFNIPKPAHENWETYSEEMLFRNKEDVRIQTKLYLHCMEKVKECKFTNLNQVVEMEQKVWRIIDQQAENGWQFDVDKAKKYIMKLNDKIISIENKLNKLLPMRMTKPYKETVCKAFKANGELTKYAGEWVKDRFDEVVGDFCRISYEIISINSDKQLKEYLLSKGWEPSEWNYKKDEHGKPLRDDNYKLILTSPKLPDNVEAWDEVAKQIKQPEITFIAEYSKIRHRKSQIEGFLKVIRIDGRIEAKAISCSTPTARMIHRQVVNVPKADEKVFFGKEMRSLFIVPKGKVLVGADASASEARCEAHYLYKYDKKAALELLEGDVHTTNIRHFKLIIGDIKLASPQHIKAMRNIAKSGKYAILYGCSSKKLADVLKKPLSMAKELYNNYWEGNSGLKQLKEDLEMEWKETGYLTAIDGRPLLIRYQHALLNTLLQSCGSIIMKLALCILDKWLQKSIIDFKFVGNFHDEFCIECWPKDAEFIGQKAVEAMGLAGRLLKLNVPITGEYKIGKDWSETH